MILSRACENALRAVIYLAGKPKNSGYTSVKEIAEQNDISFHFLGKILQKLTQRGLLNSYKGPHGGVSLAKPATEIRVIDIVEAIDGIEFLNRCVVGMPICDDKNPCALHHKWMKIRNDIYRLFTHHTIHDLIEPD